MLINLTFYKCFFYLQSYGIYFCLTIKVAIPKIRIKANSIA